MTQKILLVDDSKVALKIVKMIVVNLGHEVIGEAVNGEIGFEMYKTLKPDLVLSDLEMPVLDGYGMIEKIFNYDATAKVALISSVANHVRTNDILNLGALAIIRKPIDEKMLQKLFDNLESE